MYAAVSLRVSGNNVNILVGMERVVKNPETHLQRVDQTRVLLLIILSGTVVVSLTWQYKYFGLLWADRMSSRILFVT